MKKILFTLFIITQSFLVFSQESVKDSTEVAFIDLETYPVYEGCNENTNDASCFDKKIANHVKKNLKYPEKALNKGIQGTVKVIFLIDYDGSISNVTTSGADKILQKEAVRIVNLLPKFKPGMQKGKPVKVRYSFPITFKLQ